MIKKAKYTPAAFELLTKTWQKDREKLKQLKKENEVLRRDVAIYRGMLNVFVGTQKVVKTKSEIDSEVSKYWRPS